jgi:hypothetical protein
MCFDMNGEGQPGFVIGSKSLAGGVRHGLTKPNCPWTTGQFEQMSRTIK